MADLTGTTTAVRTCPLCEATCGLEVTLRGRDVVRIRGDRHDVFSAGFLCPKGSTLKQLDEDPDRLRRPLVKRAGRFVEVGWDEAFAEVERRFLPLVAERGRDAVAVYIGNPTAHNLDHMLYDRVLLQALGTGQRYSASTVDQMPKQLAAGFLFGTAITIPVPDIDRTDHLLVLGADPVTSNGSLMTAPDMPRRLAALRARGGRLVVVDPRRSATAAVADEHLAIVPGTDAHLLFAMVSTLFDEGLVHLGRAEGLVDGVDEVRRLAQPFRPEVVAPVCGIDADTIRRTARQLAGAPSAAVYGRIGTCTQEFGTLTSWLVDVLNVLTGNLDRPGGAMFTTPAAGSPTTSGTPRRGRGVTLGRRTTRVRGLRSALGELPVACLAEEIDTPGDGQVRALFTLAGNPVLSTPNSGRLDAALAGLDLMVSVDMYLNETTRHADVILPPPSPLARGHFDVLLYRLAIRNVANWSPPTVPIDDGGMAEWEILSRLALAVTGRTATTGVDELDDEVAATAVRTATGRAGGPLSGRDPEEVLAGLAPRRGPERLLDLLLRTGPYGDGFAPGGDGLSLAHLEANPHGIDLGPLEPRLPDVLRTPSGHIELAAAPLVDDVERLRQALSRRSDGAMVLIGRRHLRSNNSWMHNLDVLARGPERCTAQLHPEDATRLGLTDGAIARVSSRVGSVEVPVEVTDAIRPGVVSIPHGWGHDAEGTMLRVAGVRPGVNSNRLADELLVDPLSGNAVLNGIPVTIIPAPCEQADGVSAGATTALT